MKKCILEKLTRSVPLEPQEVAYVQHIFESSAQRGLHWETKVERCEKALDGKIPKLKRVQEHSIGSTSSAHPLHLLIEGENLYALMVLQETHREKIDMIYIDPPYNRGTNDFVYQDNYVDHQDEYRHSRWLSFMEKRLRLAHTLLNKEGFIFISIDHHELAQLKLLMDSIFGEENCIQIFSWVKTRTPSNLSQKTKEMVDYILCYQKAPNKIRFQGIQKHSKSDNPMLKPNANERVLHFPAGSLAVRFKTKHVSVGVYGTRTNRVELLDDLYIEEETNTQPVRIQGRFVWTQGKLDKERARGTRISIKTKSMILSYEKTSYAREVPPNLIDSAVGVGTNEQAKNELIRLDIHGFDYPKPTSLLQYLFRFLPKKEFVLLDFFAGSGTSAHAAMMLNQHEGYMISSILCTNNQNDIVTDVTYPRLKRVMEGYTSQTGKRTEPHGHNNLRHYRCVLQEELL